jgi:hypothetical protein
MSGTSSLERAGGDQPDLFLQKEEAGNYENEKERM